MNKEIKKVLTESGITTVGVGEAKVVGKDGVSRMHDVITVYSTDEADNEREGVILMDKYQTITLINALTEALMECMIYDIDL